MFLSEQSHIPAIVQYTTVDGNKLLSKTDLQYCRFAELQTESLDKAQKLQLFFAWHINMLISVCSLVFSHFLFGLLDTIIPHVVLTQRNASMTTSKTYYIIF